MGLGGIAAIAMVAAVGAGVAWLVAWNRRREQQADFDRKVRARKLGWRYDGTREERIDYRFAGAHGDIAWTMWLDSDRGQESPTPKAWWRCENLRAERLSLVILGRRRFGMESGVVGRLLIGVVSGIAAAASGRESSPDKPAFYESAFLIESGLPAFRERFAVAVAPEMPRDWLDEDLQRKLMQWPVGRATFKPEDAIEINLGPNGLSIVVRQMPDDMAHWQHLAGIGEVLAERLAARGR